MALEKRQQNIQVGAGLEESRYSQDFIELLKNWGGPAVMILALGVLGYQGLKWYNLKRENAVSAAFKEFEGAKLAGNPSALIRVAEDHAGQRAVPHLARLEAARLLLESAIMGVDSGAEFVPATSDTPAKLKNESDRLNAERRTQKLKQAEDLYQTVLKQTADEPGQEVHSIFAAYGLASVAETRGEWDQAKLFYDRVIDLSKRAKFETHEKLAKERLASLDQYRTRAKPITQAQLKTRYEGQKFIYNITPDMLRDGKAAEPIVVRADGTRIEPPAPVYNFEPSILKPKPPAAPEMKPVPGPGDSPTNKPADKTTSPDANKPATPAASPAPAAPATTPAAPK